MDVVIRVAEEAQIKAGTLPRPVDYVSCKQ
jgi:hypothetical protein